MTQYRPSSLLLVIAILERVVVVCADYIMQGQTPKALTKPGETRFGTHFTSMQSLLYAKKALKELFKFIEENPDDIPAPSQRAAATVKV